MPVELLISLAVSSLSSPRTFPMWQTRRMTLRPPNKSTAASDNSIQHWQLRSSS